MWRENKNPVVCPSNQREMKHLIGGSKKFKYGIISRINTTLTSHPTQGAAAVIRRKLDVYSARCINTVTYILLEFTTSSKCKPTLLPPSGFQARKGWVGGSSNGVTTTKCAV